MDTFAQEIRLFEQALRSLDRLAAQKILTRVVAQLSPIQGIEQVVVPALEHVGTDWEKGKIALSQIYMSGRICEELVDLIMPTDSPGRKDLPKMALTVLNDYHLLGKRLVYSVLRAGGYQLLDYGRMDVETLVKQLQKDHIEVLLVSTLMLPSALQVRKVRDKIDQMHLSLKLIVGGAPFRFDEQLWKEVGADAMGSSAADALDIVNRIVGGKL